MSDLQVFVSGQRAFGAAVAELVAATPGMALTGAASPAYRGSAAAVRWGHGDDEVMPWDRLRATAWRHGAAWVEAARLRAHHIPDGTDVILAAHSHAFLGARTRARARRAALGYHPSLLPLHRGRDAVRWTVRDGDRVTGGTVYHLTDQVDAGPIAAQDYVIIPRGITAGELWHDHLAPLGLALIGRVLGVLTAGGTLARVPQDETLATWEPSWERPPLHRVEVPELGPAGDPAAGVRYDPRPEAARRPGGG